VITEELKQVSDVEPWSRSDLFVPGSYTLPTLLNQVKISDFAILILSPDDETITRNKHFLTARDNVLIELGLFINGLDLKRTFVVLAEAIKTPSDLMGLTVLVYDNEVAKTNPTKALQTVVATLRNQIRTQGLRPTRERETETATLVGWKQPSGDWKATENKLELSSSTNIFNAAYAWSPQMLRAGGLIEFNMSIEKQSVEPPIFDFRLALFSSSDEAVRTGPSHYLIVAPWSGNNPVFGGEDIRVDYMAAGHAHHKLHIPIDPRFILGHPYRCRLALKPDYVKLDIDNTYQIFYPLDVEEQIEQGNKYWGFSSHTAHILIKDLCTNLG